MPTSWLAGTKLLPLHNGGDLGLTLRRSVRDRCVCYATQGTPRAFLFVRGPELRYALKLKAHIFQAAMCSAARWQNNVQSPLTHRRCAPLVLCQSKSAPVATCHSRPRPLFHPYRCATIKLLCARKNPNSNWTTETHASAHFRILLRPTAHSIQAHRCNLPPRSRSLRGRNSSHANLMQRRDQAPAPKARGISL